MRLPEHPLSGLLRRALEVNHLEWLERAIPEDFYQECALFLLSSWDSQKFEENPRKFFRAVGRHFYQVAVNYGFRRPRGSKGYIREAIRMNPLEDAEEDGYEKKAAIQNWRSHENSLWFQQKLEFCERVLTGDDGSGKTDWYAFQAYLSGCNLDEIAFLTGWEVSQVKEHLKEIIRRIREVAGVDPNLPMPPMPKRGKVEFRQGWKVHAGSRVKSQKPRRMAGDPKVLAKLPLKEIMARFGVSKATASRIRQRGWYCPDYHKKSGQTEPQPTLG